MARLHLGQCDGAELADEVFWVLIEVLNGVDVAVERALYWKWGAITVAGGTNATAGARAVSAGACSA